MPPQPSYCVSTPTDDVKQASWFHCQRYPESGFYNISVNGTGCCAAVKTAYDGYQTYPGVCNKCTKSGHPEFSCAIPKDLEDSNFSLSWGFLVALIADICISFGLAFQKVRPATAAPPSERGPSREGQAGDEGWGRWGRGWRCLD